MSDWRIIHNDEQCEVDEASIHLFDQVHAKMVRDLRRAEKFAFLFTDKMVGEASADYVSRFDDDLLETISFLETASAVAQEAADRLRNLVLPEKA